MNLTRSKPFHLVAGVTDVAVSTLRDVPGILSFERRDVEKAVATLQLEAVALPARAQATVVGLAEDVTGRVDDVYGDLLVRGRNVVGRIRRQRSTQDLKREATTTVRRTKAAATSAQKSATATGATAKRATKRTTTAAKKNAASTRSTASGATTAARKTTKSAAKATRAGAGKVGR